MRKPFNNIPITDYFSLIESYPGLGNAYLSNLKNTLMNMGYTAAGWTYLANEHHIYGSSRVGVHNTHFVLSKRFSTAEMEYTQKTGNQVHFIRGKRNYELSNHLGNVQVVISDKRISVCDNELQTERFEADILMATDYYPFGMAIPERQWYTGSDSSNYRFGYNGHERDDEVKGNGNSLDFGARVYDVRIGKFLSADPKEDEYPWQSTFAYFKNSPISIIDFMGEGSIEDNSNNLNDNSDLNKELSQVKSKIDDCGKEDPLKCPNLEGSKPKKFSILSFLFKKGWTYQRATEFKGQYRNLSKKQTPSGGGTLDETILIPGGVKRGENVVLAYQNYDLPDIIELFDQFGNSIQNLNDPNASGVSGSGTISIPEGTTSVRLKITPVGNNGNSEYQAQIRIINKSYIYGRKYIKIMGIKIHYGKVKKIRDDGSFFGKVVEKRRFRNVYNRQN